MQKNWKNRAESLLVFKFTIDIFVFSLALIFALIHLKTKIELTSGWFDGRLANNHYQLINFTYTNNEQSRLFQFYIPEFLHQLLGINIPEAYIVQRFVFTTSYFIAFFYYLRKWFSIELALTGLCLLAAIIPLSFDSHLQESCNLMLLTFILGLWAILEKKDISFGIILFLGSIGNETTLILAASYFLFTLGEDISFASFGTACKRTVLLTLPSFLTVGAIRYATRNNPHLGGDIFTVYSNIQGFKRAFNLPFVHGRPDEFLNFMLVFGFMWLAPLLGWLRLPLFLRRATLCIPIFLLGHFITGDINECRQMIPLAAILIPATFFCFPNGTLKHNQSS